MLTGDRTDNIEGIHGIGPVKATKILSECKTEQELYEAVWKTYQKHELSLERLTENGQLLWLRRKPDQMWLPPSTSQDASGQS
jgi:5'-3' exonuclease